MNSNRLTTEIVNVEGIPMLRVHGEIDLYTAPEFERALDEGVKRAGDILIVDLTQTSYLDSAGLSALLAAYKALDRREAMLYVIADPYRPGIRRVLEITRIDTLIQVRSSLNEILSEIRLSKAA